MSSIGAVVLEEKIFENVDRRRIAETLVFYRLNHEPEGQLSVKHVTSVATEGSAAFISAEKPYKEFGCIGSYIHLHDS